MQIIIENQDIANMDSKVLADMLVLVAKGTYTAPAVDADNVAAVPTENEAVVKAENIIKSEPVVKKEEVPAAEEKAPVKKGEKGKKADTPVEEPTEEADEDDILDDEVADEAPAKPKRTKAEMNQALAKFCQLSADNIDKLKAIANEMGYKKVKDMTEEDMAAMLEKAGI